MSLSATVIFPFGVLTLRVRRQRQAGYKINLIYRNDHGVHFHRINLSTDEVIANDPDLVMRFVRASLKGWSDAEN